MKRRVPISTLEINCIQSIVHRAQVFFPDREEQDIRMDIIAAHSKCPLRLQNLLDADDFNFVHDIVGIERHLDRHTFELSDGFRPRFAARR